MEDIVERNKKTLGRKTTQSGSYMVKHALKEETLHAVKKVCAALEETLHPAGQEDVSVPMLRLQQKTQQMQIRSSAETKVHHQSKGNEEQHKEQPGTSFSVLVDTAAHEERPSRFPSKIHDNVHVNTPSHLLLPPKQTRQDSMINLKSLNDHSSWNSVPDLVLCSESQRFNHKVSPHKSRNWQQPNNHGGRPEKCQRALEMEREHQRWNPNDETCTPQHVMTPVTSLSESMSSFTVLPPIEDVKRGSCDDDDAQSTAQPMQRCSSEGYLVKMEKQRQIQARVAHKHHAEKMEGQTVRLKGFDNQKKRISRFPVTAAKGSDGKDKNVSRTKALEYAKTIAKPTRQTKQRQKEQSNRRIEHALYQEGVDTSQLATLEFYIKRHEEEKKAVALFRKA
ncbi:jhy protein-like [Gouania willdenowi]|uniref:jhy protein-like n=1 Tax=Gouania willdenowi TaxID=441366 RepID=UPI001056456C|nr:jhy protein-like [Gouania willdenowi]